jgi:hypothetical protein
VTEEEAARILARRFGTTVELAEKLAGPVLDAIKEGNVGAQDVEYLSARERRYRLAWKSARRRAAQCDEERRREAVDELSALSQELGI